MTAAAAAASITAALIVFSTSSRAGGAHGDAGVLREVDRLLREGRDERAALTAEARELGRVEVVLRFAQRRGEVERLGELPFAGEQVHRPRRDGGLAQRLHARARASRSDAAARALRAAVNSSGAAA